MIVVILPINLLFYSLPFKQLLFGLLICTLISENQGLEKSMSALNLRKISGPANLDFFQIYSINLAFFVGGELEKNPGLQDLKFF